MLDVVGPRIKIKIVPQEKKHGMIILQSDSSSDCEIGEVIQLGHMAYKNMHDETPWCNIGDLVLFQKYAGKIDPTENDSLFRFLADKDVIAVTKKESKSCQIK